MNQGVRDRRLLRKYRGQVVTSKSGATGIVTGVQYRGNWDLSLDTICFVIETEDERGGAINIETFNNEDYFMRKQDYSKDAKYLIAMVDLEELQC